MGNPTLECPEPILGETEQGIERVAVDDELAHLLVTFYRPLTPAQQLYLLQPRSYSLSGGRRLFPKVRTAALYNPPGTPPDLVDRRVLLQLTEIGDFSIYTLTVSGPQIDSFFASVKLRFRLACDDPFDCRPKPPGSQPAPQIPVLIDYLAKDYASFRQALLDFIPTRLPGWTERSEADIGMMLLELFAYTADQLSYMQDRVANEAFLTTASQRRSVAGHLALLGYQMDEGAAAYTWLQFHVREDVTIPAGFQISNRPQRDDEPIILFETLASARLWANHNEMPLFTWGNEGCCLPKDELEALLDGEYSQLAAGDYLLFKYKEPRQEHQPGHRDIVRLVAAPEILPADPHSTPPTGKRTLVRWSPATPLQHDYCADNVIVQGNLVVATHGETVHDELRKLSAAEKIALQGEQERRRPGNRLPRQRLRLQSGPLAHLDPSTLALVAPVTEAAASPPPATTERVARSVSTLAVEVEGEAWTQKQTLLESDGNDKVYRVEIDDQGEGVVVFGDGEMGRRPDERADVTATYRVGGGQIGNVAQETLTLAYESGGTAPSWLEAVTNPLPAVGGRDLASREHARRLGPATFQQPLVAVTAADYQNAAQDFTLAGQRPVQRAKASFRWTGSWLTVTLVVDPRYTETISPELRQSLLAFLETRRLAGYDLNLLPAVYVPVEVVVEFCTEQGFQPFDVQERLQQTLSNGELPGGQKGFFHPDNFSFGDPLYVSSLYHAIMSVAGIESASILRLARLDAALPDADTQANLRQGFLPIGDDQILRLDNDRNFPENGVLTLQPKGVHA